MHDVDDRPRRSPLRIVLLVLAVVVVLVVLFTVVFPRVTRALQDPTLGSAPAPASVAGA